MYIYIEICVLEGLRDDMLCLAMSEMVPMQPTTLTITQHQTIRIPGGIHSTCALKGLFNCYYANFLNTIVRHPIIKELLLPLLWNH